jgi:hypothetical protein
VSVFIFDRFVHEIRPDDAWVQAVECLNSKNAFMDLCKAEGAPIPRTLTFVSEPSDDIDIDFPCFVKADVSATGMAVFEVQNANELRAAVRSLHGTPFQVQEKVSGASIAFLNVQYFGCDGAYAHRGEVTEQVLDGFSHIGNRCPTAYEPWHVTDALAMKAARMGLKGYFAFDVAAVTKRNGDVEYVIIECNPRWNAATYPSIIADKLKAKFWQARYFKPRKVRTLHDLYLGHLEYNPARKSGVVFVNWGMIAVGKIGCMLIGSPEEQEMMVSELNATLQ